MIATERTTRQVQVQPALGPADRMGRAHRIQSLTRTKSAPGVILHRSIRRVSSLPSADAPTMRAPATIQLETPQAPMVLARTVPVRLTRTVRSRACFSSGLANGALAALGFIWVLLFLVAITVETSVAISSDTFGRRGESNRILSITAFHLFITSQLIFFVMEVLRLVSTKCQADSVSKAPWYAPSKRQHLILTIEANNAFLGMILESGNIGALVLYGGVSGPWIVNHSNGLGIAMWWYIFLGFCFLAVFLMCNVFALIVSCVHGRFRFNGERDPPLTKEEHCGPSGRE